MTRRARVREPIPVPEVVEDDMGWILWDLFKGPKVPQASPQEAPPEDWLDTEVMAYHLPPPAPTS